MFSFTVSRARASFRESFRLKGGRKRGAGTGSVDRNGSGRVTGRRRPGPIGQGTDPGDITKPETIIEESEEKDVEK
jgi:hypothetical protein